MLDFPFHHTYARLMEICNKSNLKRSSSLTSLFWKERDWGSETYLKSLNVFYTKQILDFVFFSLQPHLSGPVMYLHLLGPCFPHEEKEKFPGFQKKPKDVPCHLPAQPPWMGWAQMKCWRAFVSSGVTVWQIMRNFLLLKTPHTQCPNVIMVARIFYRGIVIVKMSRKLMSRK